LGGVVIATAGVAWAYAGNALSYLVVIVALLMMRVDERREADDSESIYPKNDHNH